MTLFERAGGAEVIARVIAVFHARLASDAALAEAIDASELPALAPRHAAFMGWVFGATRTDDGPGFAGLIRPDLTDATRERVVAHLRAALAEIGVEPELAEEALTLLNRATPGNLELPFDLVVVETGGVRAEHSPEEFLAIPMRARAQLVLARAVEFFRDGQPVDRKVALGALRAASAAKA